MPLRLNTQTYVGDDAIKSALEQNPLTQSSVERIIREQAPTQIPPGALPEATVAPASVDGHVTSTVGGKTTWVPSEDLPGVIAANSAVTAHLNDTSGAHLASAIDVTETGLVIDESTSVQGAFRKVEEYLQNVEETLQQHHHDDAYVNVGGDVMTGTLLLQDAGSAKFRVQHTTVNSYADHAWDGFRVNNVVSGGYSELKVDTLTLDGSFQLAAVGPVASIASGFDLRRGDDATNDNALPRFSQVKVTESGLIIPGSTTVQGALRQVEEYVQNLEERFEQDARFVISPAAGPTSDGSVLTSDTTQTGGVKWRKREISTQLYTAATGAVASGTTIASFSLTGDGATAIYIHGQWDIETSATGNWVSVRVYDSTIGAGATVCQENIQFHVTGSLRISHTICYRVAPFTGTKTINIKAETSGGTMAIYGGSGGGAGGNSMGAFAEWA